MTYYNITNLSRSHGIINLAVEANNQASSYLSLLILVALFIILMIKMKNFETKRAITASSFITFLASLFMYGFGWVGDEVVVVTAVLLGVCAVMMFTTED